MYNTQRHTLGVKQWRHYIGPKTMETIIIWMIDINFYQSKKPELDYKRSQIKCLYILPVYKTQSLTLGQKQWRLLDIS